MRTERLTLIGAGGHAKVVLDAYRLDHPHAVVQVRDDDPAKCGVRLLGLAIETPIGELQNLAGACHVAIGDNAARRRIGEALAGSAATLVKIVHPAAAVAADSAIGPGVFVAARAVIAPDARVGAGTIVNHAAVVDHDCIVGAWCHIAPGAVLGGGVAVGDDCLVGSGAVVLPGVRIGAGAVIAAGAVVIDTVPAGARVAGVPAKDMHERR
jgi:sugar O-acyltransferase (sialic acid O-acetyltransferase NeuD family)